MYERLVGENVIFRERCEGVGVISVDVAREYGVNVRSANEELRAVAAGRDDAKALGLAPGTPLLEIDRMAFDIDDKPIEWRRSRCDTRHLVYAVTLR